MEAKEEIYQYIRKHIKEDGVTAQSIAEIFGIKRNVASHYLNLLEKEGKLQKGTNRPVHFSIPTDTEKKAEECNNMIDERSAAQKEVSVFSKFIGYNGSMEQVIEKCKAAVNYPVNGLTMIICGASGVGKSYLSSTVVPVMNVENLVNGFTNPSFPEFMLNKENVREFTNDIIKLFTLKGVASRLRFLNPEVVMQEVDQVIRGYENYYHVQLPNFLRINLFLHTSIMIERVLVKEESGKIDSIDTEGINEESRKFIEVSKDIFKSIMMKYKIEISDAEYLLLYQILQSVIQK